MNLAGLRSRLAHLAGAVPQPQPPEWSSDPIELALAAGIVWARLESWAEKRPGFEPMEPPTVLHQPDEGDKALARNCPQLAAALLAPCLVHRAGVLEARLEKLYAEYQAAGVPDAAVDSAMADVDEQLAALLASGVQIPEHCARWLVPLRKIS